MAQRRQRRAYGVATVSVLLRLLPLAGFDALAQSALDAAVAESEILAGDAVLLPPALAPATEVESPAVTAAVSEPVPLPEQVPVPGFAPPPDLSTSAEGPPEPLPATFGVMRNDDIVEMASAGFGERTIIAAIEANPTEFDVSPRVLVALKRAGVPEGVIETMLAVETAKQQRAAVAITVIEPVVPGELPAPSSAAAGNGAVPPMSPETLARLSEAIERLAVQTQPSDEPAPAVEDAEPVLPVAPRVWLVDVNGRTPFAASAAQVAYTDLRRLGSTSFKTLQGLASKALAFANPALSSGLSGLFGADDNDTTAVWALLGPASTRVLGPGVAFEVDFANIPGIDPAEYRPAIVQLVPTSDNYRLVGAVKTTTGNPGLPNGPIIEETLAADVVPLARGRFRVTVSSEAEGGEYALVLRPIVQRARDRRRSESSLGQLLGGASKDVLYLTWDFAIRA